jgi:hypothetical protein
VIAPTDHRAAEAAFGSNRYVFAATARAPPSEKQRPRERQLEFCARQLQFVAANDWRLTDAQGTTDHGDPSDSFDEESAERRPHQHRRLRQHTARGAKRPADRGGVS